MYVVRICSLAKVEEFLAENIRACENKKSLLED